MNAKRVNRQFVDTNIFLYAYDTSEPKKRKQAKDLVSTLWDTGMGAVSIQVLQELYVNLTRKLPRPVSHELASQIVADIGTWHLHSPSLADLQIAMEFETKYKISFWDAMIVASARQMGCSVLWTEDLNHSQEFDGLVIKNPFEA